MSDASRYYDMSITDRDRPYMAVAIEEPLGLVHMLREVGAPPQVAQSILGWLTVRGHGQLDEVSPPTRVRYRDWLDKVTAQFAPRPPGRSVNRDPEVECERIEQALREAVRRLGAAPAAILPLRARKRAMPS